MADKKITELTAYTPPIDTDVLPVVDVTSGITKKITVATIRSCVAVTRQDISSNSSSNNSVIVTGWSYFTCTEAKRATLTITFPATFSVAPIVLVGELGFHADNPTAITELQEVAGNVGDITYSLHAYDISTTIFKAEIIRETANFTANWRFGMSWMAIGILA